MVAPPTPERIPLGEAVDRYLDTVAAQVTVGQLRDATRANYAADLADLVRVLGGDVITDDVTGPDIDHAIAAYGAGADRRYTRGVKTGPGRSASTQRRFHESVSRFFGHAALHGWVQVSPMQWVTLKPTVRGDLRAERTALTADQARALLEHGPGTPPADGDEKTRSHERNYARDRLIITLLVILGPRVDELARANTDDIFTTPDGPQWRVVGKGGKVRRVPLSAEIAALVDDYLATRPAPSATLPDAARADADKALLRTGRGNRITPRDLQRLLNRATSRVRSADPDHARDATPHALRHTAATLMLANGWDVKIVSQLLGHASISSTQRYLDELPGELAVAIRSNPLLARLVPSQPRQERPSWNPTSPSYQPPIK